jgi:hypothetical protein
MGKWAEVHCSCPNRRPLSDSGWECEPHRKKRRLTAKQREERQLWEQTTKGMCECGHRNGCLLEFWPGHIIQFGGLINSAFEKTGYAFPIFAQVSNWRSYEGELLLLRPDQAGLWLSEVERIWRILEEGTVGLDDGIRTLLAALHDEDSARRFSLEKQLGEIRNHFPFARLNPLMENVRKSGTPDLQRVVEKVVEALEDHGNSAWRASNPEILFACSGKARTSAMGSERGTGVTVRPARKKFTGDMGPA